MASKDAAQDELVGQTIAGRYRIISRLGAGGMGTAYRAWDEKDGMPVVIKIPKKVFFEDPKFAERFHREIRLLEGLTHPHIAPITDVGEHEGLPFVAMRFLPGGSLSNRRLRDDNGKVRPNPPGMLHLWLPAVAEALDFVHSQGVVHRDVKPANIFFDAFWGAYLGDFGIAKIVEESDTFDKERTLTATHMGIGTQEYMCPEQFTPKAVIDGRADQYALAVMVYEMVAGTRPFTGATAHLIVEVTTQQPPPLDAYSRDLPPSLVEAVHRGLAKNPTERFPTCREFAAAVLQHVPPLVDEPDVARLLCPKCSNILKVRQEAAGRKGSCPKCQTPMKVADDLGSLWLLDEARRQRKTVESGEASELEQDAGVVIDYTEDEAIEAFKPVSSTTPIEKAARREARKVPPLAIWGGVAGVLLAAIVIWNFLPGAKPKKKSLTYAQQVAKAEATLKSDPLDRPANELLGRHWCFKEQNWDKGLPYFAKSITVGFTSAAEKELKAKETAAASPGDLIRAAQEWWKIATQPALNTPESTEAIKKHAATIYIAAVDSLGAPKDIEDATRWLDRDSDFRSLVGNKRPPKRDQPRVVQQEVPPTAKPTTAALNEIITRPPITNSIGMKVKLIPPGTFMMGADGSLPDQGPVHRVSITAPFYIGVFEVTNAQWKTVMGTEPAKWKTVNHPVETVSWEDAVEFCRKLSALADERKAGREYRLPTEAEWEYACRAGTLTVYSFGENRADFGDYGWFDGNSRQTNPVGIKKPNAFGLYDMHGNVWEWCSDWYGGYTSQQATDAKGPMTGSFRVHRGGSWRDSAGRSRSADRGSAPAPRDNLGFRVVMTQGVAQEKDNALGLITGEAGAGPKTLDEAVAPKLAAVSTISAQPPLENSIGIKFRAIPSGTFQMGANDGDPDEKPIHEVRITKPFYLGVTEVTNAQWKAVMGSVPSHSKEDDRPVEMVSWDDAIAFCIKLTGVPAEKAAARSYRLPSEAEWEYACRAGTTTQYSFGDDDAKLTDFAWFDGNAGGQTHPVGQKKANPWGLLDMHGNVFEWCSDWSGEYNADTVTNPTGPTSGSFRVYRGGSGWRNSRDCRAANRDGFRPAHRVMSLGFRVVLTQPDKPVRVDRDGLIRDTVSKVRQLRAEHRADNTKVIVEAKKQIMDQATKDAGAPDAKEILTFLGLFQRQIVKEGGPALSTAALSPGAVSPPVGLWGWEAGKWIQLNEDGTLSASWHDNTGLWDVRPDSKAITLLPHGNRSAAKGELSTQRDAIRLTDGRVLRFDSSLQSVPPLVRPLFLQAVQQVSKNERNRTEREAEILKQAESQVGQAGLSVASFRLGLKEALKVPDEAGVDRASLVGKWKLGPQRIIELLENGSTTGSWHYHSGMWTVGPDGTVSMMTSAAVEVSRARQADDKKTLIGSRGNIITREGP